MDIVQILSNAGKNFHTVMLTAKNKRGTTDTTEVEPYVFRLKDGNELLYCYDLKEEDLKILSASNIVSIEETENRFSPKYPVRVKLLY